MFNRQQAGSRNSAATTTITNISTDLTTEPDHEGILALVATSGKSGYTVGWLYYRLHEYLVNNTKGYLSHDQVGALAGGMSETAVKQHTRTLVGAGLINRVQIGNSVYDYSLPARHHVTEVTRFPGALQATAQGSQNDPQQAQTTVQGVQSATNLEEEKEEDFVLDRNRKTAVEKIPNNEQARIARQFVKDPQVIAIAASLELSTVQHIAKQSRRDKVESQGDYFAYSIRNAPVAPLHTPKPEKPIVTDKYSAWVDGTPAEDTPTPLQQPASATVSETENVVADAAPQHQPPTGPDAPVGDGIPRPPAPYPHPIGPEQSEIASVRWKLQTHMRRDYDMLFRGTLLSIDGDTLQILTTDSYNADMLRHRWCREVRRYASDAIGTELTIQVEVVS